jgi:hypothetical protein
MSKKRFRIVNNDNNETVFSANTTEEVNAYAIKDGLFINMDGFRVEDSQEDGFVDMDDFTEAFANGECPADLSFF